VAAKQLLCGILQTMLLYCFAECSTPDKQPIMISHEAFARAEVFINETARPLERTLFAFYFTHGSRDAVITTEDSLPASRVTRAGAALLLSER